MDNFDYKSYLRSGKIHGDKSMLTESEQVSEKKKQGYDDREDESLGARRGAEKGKKQSMKARRDDSYGKFGKRDAEKKGKNKINKESQEVDESLAVAAGVASIFGGAAALSKIMDKLEKGDLGEKGKSIAKSLASLGNAASSVRKESQEVDESLAVAAGVASIFGGAAAMAKIMDKLEDGALGDKGKKVANMLTTLGKGAANRYNENIEENQVDESALAVGAGVAAIFGGAAALQKIMDKLEDGALGEKGKKLADTLSTLGKGAANRYNEGYSPNYEEDDIDPMSENARTDAEEEGYEDGFKDAKDDMKDAMSKMKVSELKAKIRENILSTLNEADEEDMDHQDALDKASATGSTKFMKEADEEVDVDIDVKDEVEVDAEADDIEIERKGVKAKVEVGLSPEEEIVQDSLKAAMDAAEALGSDKLADQIGNTITFFTRQFVVGDRTD